MDKDRFEKEDVKIINRVEQGYAQIAAADPQHIHVLTPTGGLKRCLSRSASIL